MAETTKNNYKHRRWQATDKPQTIPVCRGATDEHPALARWRAQFAKDGDSALGRALSGQVSLGPYDRDRPSGALGQILRPEERPYADKSLRQWLAKLLGKPAPTGLSDKRFAGALQEAFWLAGHLGLADTIAWCAAHRDELSCWLRDFHFGSSRDPESALRTILPGEKRLEHELKTDPVVFQALRDGTKTYEIRRDDRGFRPGHALRLRETRYTGEEMRAGAPLEYTGCEECRIVTHILRGPIYGLLEGWAILSVSDQRDVRVETKGNNPCGPDSNRS